MAVIVEINTPKDKEQTMSLAEKCFSDDETIVPSGTIVPTPQSNIKPAYNKNN